MDDFIICDICGAKISLKYNAFPGSSTESDSYDCPKCGNYLFSSRDSGYYELSVISENTEVDNK